jgi:hypothetical protein
MKYSLVLVTLLSVASFAAPSTMTPAGATVTPVESTTVAKTMVPAPTSVNVVCPNNQNSSNSSIVLDATRPLLISVVGQGVAPMNTASPAQAYALAKRAAVADAYRLIAEKVKGVRVDGQDLIQNMMVKRSTVRTSVEAMVKNANIVETTFKEGLCEVEMEITLSHSQFPQ